MLAKIGLVLASVALATAAQAEIQSFTVVRTGGGEIQVRIEHGDHGSIIGTTIGCNFQSLTPEAAARTRFALTGRDQTTAGLVLANRALIASVLHFGPIALTGTWLSLKVTELEPAGPKTTEVASPVVLIDGRISDLLTRIEDLARITNQNHSVCQ